MANGRQVRTIEKVNAGAIAAWLKARHERNTLPASSSYWRIFLFVTANLVLLAFLVFDVPAAATAGDAASAIRSVSRAVTDIGKSGWILFGSAFVFLAAFTASSKIESARRRFQALYTSQIALYLFATVALSGLSANLIKRAIGRARPIQFEEWGAFAFSPFAGNARFESFPSGHATTIGALFMALALLLPRYRVVLAMLAVWLGMTRVMVGAHYPSDVTAGLAFGAWFSLFIAIAFSRYGIVFKTAPNGLPVPRLSLLRNVWPGFRARRSR
ncbi:undecaprenyl-diphosphatase [Ciceribacter lividus]|uniref:Undecaprenyl-diphosphatase n=1 Tax=Ciceribacter lividus TaxID=1197950 RepID=A0A6I7HP03_9HYPH|nr:lipid A 1-phosphatase LpxE [Ciceribacter lividus]RCW25802.1 undecaprenyl-diphosphatase [Ciceribacter lividus]